MNSAPGTIRYSLLAPVQLQVQKGLSVEKPEVIQSFYKAGVDVKMITGDYPETAVSIAKLTGIKTDKVITGNELLKLSDDDGLSEGNFSP